MDTSSSPTVALHNLRDGFVTTISRNVSTERPLGKAVVCAVVGSAHNECAVPVLHTPFEAYASFQTLANGTALWWISAARELGQGRVKPGARLYACTVAAELAHAPLAWRHIMQGYVGEVVVGNLFTSVNAPGLMPRRPLPWGVGYVTNPGTRLTAAESTLLHQVIAIGAGYIANRCIEGSAAAVKAGKLHEIDPDRYLELQDW
jgi:hypothetical protein